MPNVHAVHSVGHSLITWLKNAYPAELRASIDADFLLLSSGEMASKDERGIAVSLWLYRITPNEHLRNAPRRRDDADLPPALHLDLHYLLTVWADNALAEHTLAAWAMQRLHEHPVLELSTLTPEGGWEASDRVQVIPQEVSGEELMRLWDAVEPGYRLSVPYVARVVRLDPVLEPDRRPVVATRFVHGAPEALR
jgi:hypothetical protein